MSRQAMRRHKRSACLGSLEENVHKRSFSFSLADISEALVSAAFWQNLLATFCSFGSVREQAPDHPSFAKDALRAFRKQLAEIAQLVEHAHGRSHNPAHPDGNVGMNPE